MGLLYQIQVRKPARLKQVHIYHTHHIINSLEGVSYEWKDSGTKDFGFIAEDVGKILPGIVQWEDNGKDATGIDYSRIVSYLVEAVKEQQEQIEMLNQRLEAAEEKK